MTLEQQRIALAKWEGWKLERGGDGEFCLINPNGLLVGSDFDPSTTFLSFIYKLPDYLNDLNAVARLEEMLTLPQMDVYVDLIGGSLFRCIRASAAQRCEALLKTLGLWTD